MAEREHAHGHEQYHEPQHVREHDHGPGHKHQHAGHEHHDHDHGQDHELEKGEQTVSVEDAGPARKRLTIEVPQERIAKAMESKYAQLKNEAVLPGFRRGRAPLRLLEKRFGTSVRDDVRGQLLSQCYSQAIEEQKLEVIGEPDIKDAEEIKLPDAGPLKFQVEVEVAPQVTLPPLEGIEVERPTMQVTDEDLQTEIKAQCERLGEFSNIEGAAAQNGDFIQADVAVYEGENAEPTTATTIAHHPGAFIVVRSEGEDVRGHVAGIVIDDLGKRLAGKSTGHVEKVSMAGPAGHEDERIKGKPITIVIRVDQIQRRQARSVEELVKIAQLESVEDLNKRMREMLEGRRERQQRAVMHQQVCDHLIEKVQFELPEGLSARQTVRLLRRQALELAYQGVSQQEIEQRIAELRSGSESEARRQLKLFFILNQVAKELNVEVSEPEVNSRVAMMAMEQNRRPEKLRQQMQRSGELDQLYQAVRDQKVLDRVVEKAKVTEIDAKDYEAKMKAKVEAQAKEQSAKASAGKDAPRVEPSTAGAKEKKESKAEAKSEAKTEAKAEAKPEHGGEKKPRKGGKRSEKSGGGGGGKGE